MAMLDLLITSPLWGEVGAQTLTPTLSPQGRGGDGAAAPEESTHGNA